MNATETGSRKGWHLAVPAMAALSLVIAGVVWLIWDGVREDDWFQAVKGVAVRSAAELRHTAELQAFLLAEYPAEEVSVQVGAQFGSDKPGEYLEIRFIKPQDLTLHASSTGPEIRSENPVKARDIARVVAKRYPGIERYDYVKMEFAYGKAPGLTVGGLPVNVSANFNFPVGELLQEPAESSS